MSKTQTLYYLGLTSLIFAFAISFFINLQTAQAQYQDPQQLSNRDLANSINAGKVTMMAGNSNTNLMKIALDMTVSANDGDNLRLVPVMGIGTRHNIRDILYLQGIDMGITDIESMEFSRLNKSYSNLTKNLAYVTLLFPQSLYLLTDKKVESVEDLVNLRVNFGQKGSGSDLHAKEIFKTLNIPVKPTYHPSHLAIEKLNRSEIDAVVCFCLDVADNYNAAKETGRLHVISIPTNVEILKKYLPSFLSSDDFPDLIPEGKKIPTAAVRLVLVSYNWRKTDLRYKKVARFIEAFFARISQLKSGPRSDKWRQVNLAAELPNWKRFEPARAWLAAQDGDVKENLRDTFNDFLVKYEDGQIVAPSIASNTNNTPDVVSPPPNVDPSNEKLFRDFMQWRQLQGR